MSAELFDKIITLAIAAKEAEKKLFKAYENQHQQKQSDLLGSEVNKALLDDEKKEMDKNLANVNKNRKESKDYNISELEEAKKRSFQHYLDVTVNAFKNCKDWFGCPLTEEKINRLVTAVYNRARPQFLSESIEILNETFYGNNERKYCLKYKPHVNINNHIFSYPYQYTSPYFGIVASIWAMLENHNYELHSGFGIKIDGKKYSDGAAKVHTLLTEVLKREKQMNFSSQYEELCQQVRNALTPKMQTTIGFYGFGARDKTTVALYQRVMDSLESFNVENPHDDNENIVALN